MIEITKQGFAVIQGDEYIGKWAKESGRIDHDQNSLPQILKYLKEGDVVVDGGAYCGDWSYALANSVGSNGLVWVFEPNPIALEALRYNVKDLPQVKVDDRALSFCGDKNNYILNYNDSNVGASFLVQKEKGTNFTTCIDALGLKRCDLIKIDCEGFEYNILTGAIETIFQYKPVLVIEINKGALERLGHTPQMIFGLLDEMHYFYRNIYVKEPMAGEQYDIIAFHKSKQ